MSTYLHIPTSELSDIGFSTEPPSISFRHNDQKYWMHAPGSNPDDAGAALLLYSQLRSSSSITPGDSGSTAYGFHILSSIEIIAGPTPKYDSISLIGFGGIITLFLMLIVVRLYSPFKKTQ